MAKKVHKFKVPGDKRNTSKTFRPGPEAVSTALRACKALRKTDPALVQWIEEGHPNLTEQEHQERFGYDYKRARPKKK